ncbi:hypothetical protein LSAT2_033086 [Lamellibrachia satsuma]|nr:hypothetical protein LSAT2_033086 [Lamellibrachia satsuma]
MLHFKDVCRRDMKACSINKTSWKTTTIECGIWRVRVREGVKASEEKRNTTWTERRQQRNDRENNAPVLPSAYICRIYIRCRIVTLQLHQHIEYRYPGDTCTSEMTNVRGLLVLSLVCLLLCQMTSLSEACGKRKCHSLRCGIWYCHRKYQCGPCVPPCVDAFGNPHISA